MAYFATGTWLAISVGATLAGSAYSAYSSYEAGQNAAAISRYNAQQQQAQNEYALKATAAKSLAEREENDKVLASQEASFAAAGVVINEGSPLTVRAKQAALLERKALNTDYEGAIAYREGAGRVTQDQMEGAAAKQAGNLNAVGTLLAGAGNAAGTYAKFGASKK